MKKPRGLILYEGPSKLDGNPIVVIATLKTSNRKTGAMIQTWILNKDHNPVEAIATGAADSICGNCPHKLIDGKRTCYVNVGQAPNSIYKAYKRGRYPVATVQDLQKHLKGRAIRFGAYGDPAAAPTWIWKTLANIASTHTGYTHQASHKSFDPNLANYVMVSADTPRQAAKYQEKGYRTFRVKTAADGFDVNEIECLADSDGFQCIDCGLCDGNTSSRNGGTMNIAITAHGAQAAKFTSPNIIASVSL
jgi:hypothetical protein